MNLGFFTMPIHPLDKDWRVTLQEDREAFVLADELGFTEAYCGEHVTDQAENITSCGLFLSWIAKDIKRMRLGTGTINLPNSHPAAVAGQIAMLDHMLDGRFNFGISPGGLLSDAEIFGNLDADRNAMFVEGIDAVLKIWEGHPPYAIEGRFWKITTERTMMEEIGQGFVAKPLQKPHPPIMVTVVAPHSKGVTEAAARGWLPISANFLLPKWVATHWPKYVEGRERVGAVADPNDWRVAKSVFVANDLATAREYALGPKSPYRFYYNQLLTKMKANRRGVAVQGGSQHVGRRSDCRGRARRSRHMGHAGQGRRRTRSVSGNGRKVRNAALRWKGLARSRARPPLHGSPCREGDPEHANDSERRGRLGRRATERRRVTVVTSPGSFLASL